MTDFAQPIRNIDGNPEKRQVANGSADSPTLVDLSLGWIVRQILAQDLPIDQNEGGDQKIARIALALKIPTEGELALTAAEIALIRSRAGQAYGAVVNYRLAELLDPAALRQASA